MEDDGHSVDVSWMRGALAFVAELAGSLATLGGQCCSQLCVRPDARLVCPILCPLSPWATPLRARVRTVSCAHVDTQARCIGSCRWCEDVDASSVVESDDDDVCSLGGDQDRVCDGDRRGNRPPTDCYNRRPDSIGSPGRLGLRILIR